MPTSSQSRILSVVDYQLHQKQQQPQEQQQQETQFDLRDGPTTKPVVRISINRTSVSPPKRRPAREERRFSFEQRVTGKGLSPSPPPPNVTGRRRSSGKLSDGLPSARPSQRQDFLRMPVININDLTRNDVRTNSTLTNMNDLQQQQQLLRPIRPIQTTERTKSTFVDSSKESVHHHRQSFSSGHDEPNNDDDDDDDDDNEYRRKVVRQYPTPAHTEDNNTSISDVEHLPTDENLNHDESIQQDAPSNTLDDNARRLLLLGTIRPSRTFYRNLPETEVDHLMTYFRRMKQTNQKVTSEEINQELSTKHVTYKPKIFFDSAAVTRNQVTHVEKIIEPYAEQIRSRQVELTRLENPTRFVIKPVDNETPLTIIPREYNDCVITLVTQTDPLRKSKLVSELVREPLLEDVKNNSLDISYFPGGVNYDVPREEIDESGQMTLETYQKLKKRLTTRQVWYFNGPPEKRPNALIALIPIDTSIRIDHQRLLEALYERIKSFPTDENVSVDQRILSLEFIPLNCILNSNEISNQFIIECDTNETKQQLMENPLKIPMNKQTILIDLMSYDENMRREYEKFIKAEKYRELIKNHDEAKKRASSMKKHT